MRSAEQAGQEHGRHRGAAGRQERHGTALLAALMLAGCGAPPPPLLRVAGEVALLEHLAAARTTPSLVNLNRPRIEALRADLGGGPVPALFAHPPARLEWRLRLDAEVELETALGLQAGAWERSGDGVVFVVEVRDRLGAHELRRVTLDPRQRAADRGWRPLNVDLSAWRGRTIRLTLRTDAGARGDAGWDWAVWRAPTLRRSGGGG